MNKHLLRGLIPMAAGAFAVSYSLNLMQEENGLYKLMMASGVIAFGIGVLYTLYGLFRKIDLATLQKYRREQHKIK